MEGSRREEPPGMEESLPENTPDAEEPVDCDGAGGGAGREEEMDEEEAEAVIEEGAESVLESCDEAGDAADAAAKEMELAGEEGEATSETPAMPTQGGMEEAADGEEVASDPTEEVLVERDDWEAFPGAGEEWGEPGGGEGAWGAFTEDPRAGDDDDDFGDFGEAAMVEPESLSEEPGLAARLAELVGWGRLGEVLGRGEEEDEEEQGKGGLELGRRVEGDEEVWRRLEDPAASPGLDYVWRGSAAYSLTLATLGMDQRVVVSPPVH
jgi:hypothetical protein